jgi:K(+)-stimulated pyrophosphate-energized sodium pump
MIDSLGVPNFIIAFALFSGVLALLYAFVKSRWVIRCSAGSELMVKIAQNIDKGANAFMKREYGTLSIFVVLITLLLFFFDSSSIAIAFAIGAVCSALAGYFGMHTATAANVRTAEAARRDLNGAMNVAFSGGSVMGMAVVGLALVGLTVILYFSTELAGGTEVRESPERMKLILKSLSGFAMGA